MPSRDARRPGRCYSFPSGDISRVREAVGTTVLHRRRQRLFTAVLVVVSFVFSIGAAEMVLRLGNFQITEYAYNLRKYGRLVVYDHAGGFTRHVPNGNGFVYGVDVRFNAAGMRDREHPIAKPPGTRRVLILGDSVTAGLGVAWEDTFVHRLEGILNARSRTSNEVLAAAVPGWNTVAERKYLFAEGFAFDPDVVALVYVSNDNEVSLPWGPGPPLPLHMQTWQWLADHSRLVEAASFVYRRHRPRSADSETWQMLRAMKQARDRRSEEPHAFEPEDPGWLASRDALADIAAATRARGVAFVIILYNLGGPDAPTILSRLREFSASSGVPVLDSAPWFASRPAAQWLNASLHPDRDGHAVFAEGLARALEALPQGSTSRPVEAPRAP